MYQFIVLLRALAAVIITNAHYEQIYPLAILANGGLFGDVLFFAISGFCLYQPKKRFGAWYLTRLRRVYPPVWIITGVYMLLRFYRASTFGAVLRLFLYPTYYHFVASLLILYVLFYAAGKIISAAKLDQKKGLRLLFACTLGAHLLIYVFGYDKSYYHIDSVYEPMIRFLFFESMLLGAMVRENVGEITQRPARKTAWAVLPMLVIYAASKLMLVRFEQLAGFQIVNQMLLLGLLWSVFVTACSLENTIRTIPERGFGVIRYLSERTLEIYLVQYALIPRLNIGWFPLNFVLVTGSILIAAELLYRASAKISGRTVQTLGKRKQE